MKILFSLVAVMGCLSAAELIHVSNNIDTQNLNALHVKYKKEIIVSKNAAYLVPSECLLVRHFGGISQNSVEVVGKELQSGYLSMTQELFDAKDVNVVKQEIQKQKISDTLEAKEVKAFLQESDGHLYGGISQGLVDLEEQKVVIKELEQKSETKITEILTCKLLNDGSGYALFGSHDTKIYDGTKFRDVKEVVLFK